jgi:2-aminoadipate transaminase
MTTSRPIAIESSPTIARLRRFGDRAGGPRLRQTGVVAETHDRATPGAGTPAMPPHRRAHMRARDLERYADLFAERTRVMRSSAMRDLMEITARPEVISLAGGLPDTSTFPPQAFAAQMTRIAQESSAEALQYGPTEGFAETKECVREVMRAEGMDPDPDDVIITTGGQQAIDLVTKTLVDPGDIIIAEAPTYPGAVPVFCSYQAETLQVAIDNEGMRMDELEGLLDRLAARGRRPKFIYSVPSFQNPAGVTLSPARRRRLVELARERELLVIEDNPYGLLRYEGEPTETLYKLEGGDYVIYLGTLSKILSPGIRLGWLCAPPPVMEKIVLGKQAADLCSSTLTQYFVREYFAEGRWLEYVRDLRDTYRARRDAMLDALERFFPAQASWSRPQGGLFCWATLPPYIDTTDLLAKALRENVAFVPGAAAYADGRGGSAMRLNFSASGEEVIREGIRRIGNVIAEQVELFETITAEHEIPRPSADPATPGSEAEEVGGTSVIPFRRQER